MKSKAQLRAAFDAAQTLQGAGRLAEAERAWLDLAGQAPGHAGVLANLAMVQWQLGRFGEAEDNAARAVAADPDMVQAWAVYAAAAEVRGADAPAIERYERALALNPDLVTVLQGLAKLYRKTGDIETARRHAQRLAALAPDMAEAHDALGAILLATGELEGAERALGRAIAIAPGLASAHSNLGALLAARRQWRAAMERLDLALSLDGDLAEAHNNRANALSGLGRHEEADAAFARALALLTEFPDARFNQALLWLKLGRWRDAWPGFEARWQTRQMIPFRRDFAVPRWHGAAAPGKTLLIHAEQGIGDMMMVARYLPAVARRVGHLVVECHPRLSGLLAAMDCEFDCIAAGGDPPPFDLHLPAMSLPGLFGAVPDEGLWNGPYLRAPGGTAPPLAAGRGPDGPGLNVGLAWAGAPDNPNDAERSVALDTLAPLLDVSGCRFFSFQHGPAADRIAAAGLSSRIVDLRPHMTGFGPTADLAAGMDLIISVCTSVAHLAGGMGLPVWVLLSADADWRWLLGRDDSPWYPSARLFRQHAPGGWAELVERVAQALAHEAGWEKSR